MGAFWSSRTRDVVLACLTRKLFMAMVPTLICACGHPLTDGYSPSGDEPALNEKYTGFPALPASRKAFDEAVAKAGLATEARVQVYAPDGLLTCPGPLRAPKEIRLRIKRCLMIYGKTTAKFSEQYVAFIDANNSVMFVENWYQYPAR